MKWFASSVFWKASIVCSPSFCMERACGSVRGLQLRVKGSGFRSRHDHRAGGQGLRRSGLMLPESLAPARAAVACTGMVAEGPRAAAALRFPTPLSGSIRAPGIPGRGSGAAQHTHSTDPRSGVVRRHHMYDQTFQRAFKRAVEQAGITKPATPHTSATRCDGLAPQRLRHSNRAGSARPFRRLYDDDLHACAESWRCRSAHRLMRCRPH